MSPENGERALDCQAVPPAEPDSATPLRILVIRLSALGDFIMALPAMAAIRRHHPAADITLLTTRPFVELGERSGWFNRVQVDPKPRWHDVAGWRALRRMLRAGQFDRVYDLQAQDRTAAYFHLFWPFRKPEWSGVARGASHPHKDPTRRYMHAYDIHAAQLAVAGIEQIPPPDLAWLDEDIRRFGLPSRFALLIPGSAPHRPGKRWPIARYGMLASGLLDRGVTPVVIGTPGEQPLGDAIRALCPRARSLIGQTSLFTIAGLARRAQLAVGNDTGPMHLIAMLDCPVVSLFSSDSDPVRSAPRGASVTVIRRDDLGSLSVDEVMAALTG